MQQRTVLSLLLGCTVVAVLVWLWTRGSTGEVAPPQPVAPAPSAVQEDPQPRTGGAPPATPQPTVTISALALERYTAPPAPLSLAAGADGERRSARVVAGVGAGFDAVPDRRGPALVALREGGRELLRHVAVDPLQPPELSVGARVLVRGAVTDEQQQPVPGASVWFGEVEAGGAERRFPVDVEGAFEADVPMGGGVPFVVRAPGFASTWRVLSVDRHPTALRETLRPASVLRVQLAGMAVEIERARVFVLPARDGVSSEVAQWPFFAQLRSDGYAVDARGEAVIRDLPGRGAIEVVVRHPLAALAAPTTVTLSAEPQRATARISFGARVVRGAVVGEDGAAVEDAWLFSRVAGRPLAGPPSARLLPPHLSMRGGFVARVGAGGDFSVGAPDDDDAQVAVRARGYAGRDLSVDVVEQGAVVLPRWQGGDASLRVAPPVPGEPWRLVSDLGDGVSALVAADEWGHLALPRCGRFEVVWRVELPGRAPLEFALPSLPVTGAVELRTVR